MAREQSLSLEKTTEIFGVLLENSREIVSNICSYVPTHPAIFLPEVSFCFQKAVCFLVPLLSVYMKSIRLSRPHAYPLCNVFAARLPPEEDTPLSPSFLVHPITQMHLERDPV